MKFFLVDISDNVKFTLTKDDIRVQRYRWVTLILFCFLTIVNLMQVLQFTIIANLIAKYFDISSSIVHMTGTIFFIIFILLFLPINYLIQKYSLRVTIIVSSTLTFAGILVKLFCCDASKFYVLLIGQGICACGQVYVLSIPSKLASVWFGSNELSTACSIAVMSIQAGGAIGGILPPFLIYHDTVDAIGHSLYRMLILNAIMAGIVFILILLFFRAKPDYPPSKSQRQLLSEDQPSGISIVGSELYKNKDFLCLLFTFGLSYGIYNGLGVVFNTIYIEYFPNGETDLGITTGLSIICGGVIGSTFFGFLLDKTHQFKKLSITVLVMSCLCFILEAYTVLMSNRVGTFFTIPIFEFFIASTYTIGIEFVTEVSYPVPESTSCGALNAIIYLFAIGSTFTMEFLIGAAGYLTTLIVILCAFVLCIISLMFVSSNFRRTKANLMNEIDL
ncbi:unnamed protein product [Phaedon cochleariae]|uniref:Major facilitator superfamily (MFS) profile domain-containing protein n=1 Tax=Phaedon cochleariae TaxID=80249 RepID=A0A9N9X1E6_PHACE|nr:unnamed protein product [Phaedon cochleariae]